MNQQAVFAALNQRESLGSAEIAASDLLPRGAAPHRAVNDQHVADRT